MKIIKGLLIIAIVSAPLTGCDQLMNVANTTLAQNGSTLSESEVAAGLREALKVGIQNGATKLSAVNGYFGNSLIKILMPSEAQNVESKLRELGFGNVVDNTILSMNRAAENAAIKAIPIFSSAISSMSITNAMGILKGGNNAATTYLKNTTMSSLVSAFRPEIQNSLNTVNATKYWNEVFTTYNKIPFVSPVNTDLTGYVTQKAIDGLFTQIAAEEANIRSNPGARVSDILKKVFGS